MTGRPPNLRREAYVERFHLTQKNMKRYLSNSFMDQLDRCKDDEARRLLLGVNASSETATDAPSAAKTSPGPTAIWPTSSAAREEARTVSQMLSLNAKIATLSKNTAAVRQSQERLASD